jgi:hypothetical protein
MRTMNRTAGFLSFALAIGVLIVLLAIINWVPTAFQKDTFRRYRSIDEVRAALNIRDIYVPSYFPQHIVWPPSEILAQGRPFPAVVMEFKDAGSGKIVLVLSQSQGGPFPAGPAIVLATIKETVPFIMKGRSAVLVVGECAKNEPCSRITWKEGPYTVTALMKASPFELTRITDSMLR